MLSQAEGTQTIQADIPSQKSQVSLNLLTSVPQYDQIDKQSLLAYQLAYSSLMCVITHPLSVMQTVSENQKRHLTALQRNENFFRRLLISYSNTVSVKRSFELIYRKSKQERKGKVYIIRSLYTAFPCLTLALIMNDLLFFIPQIYLTSKLGLHHWIAGTINATAAAIVCTPLYTTYRHQVRFKTLNQSHSFMDTIRHISGNVNTERCPMFTLRKFGNSWKLEGKIPRFYRSMGIGILMFPTAGIMWTTYEFSRKKLQNYFQTTHVITNFFAGVSGGLVNAFIARPIGNIAARKQLSIESQSYSQIFNHVLRNEGIASFWAGLSARMIINSIRMGFFFSAFSLLVTYSMPPQTSS